MAGPGGRRALHRRDLQSEGRPLRRRADARPGDLADARRRGGLLDDQAETHGGRRPRVIILHASDLHFGKPHLPAVAEAVLRFVEEQDPDAVVVSGDLTQRARAGEYRAARRFLARLAPRPLVVTAGNHDVPLYRVWERIFAPYRKYRTYIGDRLDTVLDVGRTEDPEALSARAPAPANGPAGARTRPGARFVALNSSAPHTAIVNGRLTDAQLRFAEGAFAGARPHDLRVLVVHHNLLGPLDGEPINLLPRARHILRAVEEWGVDLVLSGHIHRSDLGLSRCAAGAREEVVPVVTAGTASSNRGRGPEEGRNSLNLVRVQQSSLEVMVYLYCEDSGCFMPGKSRRYVRRTG
ncbi:MAG: metallophosphoesterase [Gemmatimonadetes bacterium]|nr:metallophosphoesterase [Gemmatimonadota bacterium]MYE15174.1 metallophosphoesterase [Gemmatimonadota bacterium]